VILLAKGGTTRTLRITRAGEVLEAEQAE
jgi:hypothetical protein